MTGMLMIPHHGLSEPIKFNDIFIKNNIRDNEKLCYLNKFVSAIIMQIHKIMPYLHIVKITI